MSWITITNADIESAMTATEKQLFTKSVTDIDPCDRTCNIIADVIAMVRGYVIGCERNYLPSDDTLIPVACKYHALSIIRYRILTALPGYTVDEARQKEYDGAMSFLTSVANCTIGIIPPEGVTVDATSNIAKPSVYTDRCRRFTRSTQNGW